MKQGSINKRKDLFRLALMLVILVLLNYVSSGLFMRFDLTAEKRYSLTPATKQMLSELEDVVLVKIYLEGDLPSGFTRLQNESKEMLDEFSAYSNDLVQYEFINPSESPDQKTRNEVYKGLYEKGLMPTDLEVTSEDGSSNKIVWPGAIFAYQGKERAVQILKSQMGTHPEVMLNNSIQQLEYEFSSAIRKLKGEVGGKIAFIEGHGELDELEVADITKSLAETYTVERVRMNEDVKQLREYATVIIAKPDSVIPEKHKFVLDQFIMRGGKVLWLVDAIDADMDSLQSSNMAMGLARSLNLDDMLFKYGVRMNPVLVTDLRSMPIPIVTGYIGNQPRQEFFPWYFFPILMSEMNHPVVANLEGIKTEFVNTLDTVGGAGVKKTALLRTSQYSRIYNAPVRISLNMLREKPNEKLYVDSFKTVAVLLEGEFESVFRNRVVKISDDPSLAVVEKSIPTAQIVVADGDIIRNRVNRERQQYYPLEYDKYTRRAYGNKDFILNCVNYLSDDSGLIAARSKQFKIRLLDAPKAAQERMKWQLVNTAGPVALVALGGLLQLWIRRRKYGK